jgi:hypothetical protein
MDAVISKCGRYRYRLGRDIGRDVMRGIGPTVAFIGVNPSTADAETDDATVRKWRGFASRWGCDRMVVGNLFAYRATDVRELATADDPVGHENNEHLRAVLDGVDLVVPCWGSRGKLPPNLRYRIDDVRRMLRACASPVRVLGLTTSGDPKHPLMLGYSSPLQDWTP